MEGHTKTRSKRIHLCVCGGIAAYKVAELASALGKSGYDVQVAMTPMAQKFVGPLTFQAITSQPVFTSLSDPSQEGQIGHIEFAQSCDVIVVAPASANMLAKAALGLGDDPVSTTLLAANQSVIFVPAMNTEMWRHPATLEHVQTLRARGHVVMEPDSGPLACGTIGPGRLPELNRMLTTIDQTVSRPDAALSGKRVLIAGGPTREYLDAVRFLSNPSSGKSAVALALESARRGAQVSLVLGPSNERIEHAKVERVDVVSAAEMSTAMLERCTSADLIIMCAAVADWTPVHPVSGKAKKVGETSTVEMKRTQDILQTLGAHDARSAFTLVGYAAETENVVENAREKCLRKQADLIVANDVSDPKVGFASTENRVTLVTPGKTQVIETIDKRRLAAHILEYIVTEFGL